MKTFEYIHRDSHPRGAEMVDRTMHASQHDSDFDLFKSQVVDQESAPSDDSHELGGVTSKLLFNVSLPMKHGVPQPKARFMVKPYHEEGTCRPGWNGAHYPIAGWAEMATQALFHAGGIGRLNQKVATFADPHNNGKPILAVKMDDKVISLNSALNEIRKPGDIFDNDYKSSYSRPNVPVGVMRDLAKIGFMDFLCNHQDRHASNLMVEHEVRNKKHHINRVLSIDNGRSFGYREANRFGSDWHAKSDTLLNYLTKSAMHSFSNLKGFTPKVIADTCHWWSRNRKAIVAEWKNQLGAIKDVHAREWMQLCFNDRVKALDSFVKRYWLEEQGDWKKEAKKAQTHLRENPHGEEWEPNKW